jgi:phenylacetate-CoA ligase
LTYWNPKVETMPRDRLQELQLARLRSLVARVSRHSSFYEKVFAEAGIEPGDVRSLDDLAKLPFTTKADLRSCYPFGMLAIPRREVIRVHASSGTTGKPTVVAYSKADMEVWGEVMARCLTAAGVTADDVVHIAAGYGLFTGGLGIGLGAETVGAMSVPASTGFTKRQLMLMEDFGATGSLAARRPTRWLSRRLPPRRASTCPHE